MKVTVIQTTTIRRTVDLEWDPSLPMTPEAAVAVAKATKAFDGSDREIAGVVYEIHDNAPEGCHVAQVSGRASSADTRTGKGGNSP